MTAPVFEFLPPTWEIWVEFPAPAIVGIWGVNRSMEAPSVSVS